MTACEDEKRLSDVQSLKIVALKRFCEYRGAWGGTSKDSVAGGRVREPGDDSTPHHELTLTEI